MVPVAIVGDLLSAQVLRSVLEDCGIPAAVVGERAMAIAPFAGPVTPVTLMVRRGDHARAVETVTEYTRASPWRPDACSMCGYDLRGLPDDAEVCPECGEPATRLASLGVHVVPMRGSGAVELLGVSLGWLVLILVGVGVFGGMVMALIMFG